MDAIPKRMRRRIIQLYQAGHKTGQIVQAMGTSKSGTRRIWQVFRETGSVEPRVWHGGQRPKLTPQQKQELAEMVDAQPDIFMRELTEQVRERFGVEVSRQTVGQWVRELDLTRKKSRSTPASRTAPTSRSNAIAGSRS